MGKTWGLNPKVCHWIYTAVIRPKLSYAALVWLPAVIKSNTLFYLDRVQRLALLNIFGVMRSTPTAGMECLVGLPPLHLFLQGTALSCMIRLARSGQWIDWIGVGSLHTRKTHIELCTRNHREIPIAEYPCDLPSELLPSDRGFAVEIKSKSQWRKDGSPARSPSALDCYTDGSKLAGRTGAAFFADHEDIPLGVFPLGTHATVYQAEVLAILEIASTSA